MRGFSAVDALWREMAEPAPMPMINRVETTIAARLTEHDCAATLDGFERGLVTWREDTHFDTLDRPRPPKGRWWLTEKDGSCHRPCWEFVPQIAAYVELIRDLGFHHHRVLFDTPPEAGQLDLAVMGDGGCVVVLGEAKKESRDLDKLLAGLDAYHDAVPEFRRGDEPRQLAWRLWKTRADYLWLVGPGDRRAFKVEHAPLRLARLICLPSASDMRLASEPAAPIRPFRIG